MEHQRRVPRRRLSRAGQYRIDQGPPGECRVLDISTLGVGVELLDPVRTLDLIGQRVAIRISTVLVPSDGVCMLGEIRNVAPAPGGRVRIGVEFVGQSETAILDGLRRIDAGF